MSAARVIDLFPSTEPTTEDLARALLELRAQEERLRAQLLPRLAKSGGVEVPGMGRVSYVRASTGTVVDTSAAVAALVSAGLEVPLKPVPRAPSLRVTTK